MLCHDALGFRKFNMASSFYMVFEMASSRNCYLFCLVCFSICMNISHKLFIFNLWSISLSPFQFSFGIEYVQTSQWNEDHISFFSLLLLLLFLFSFMQTPEHCWIHVSNEHVVVAFFLNRRQAESSLDYIHISRTTLTFFVVVFFCNCRNVCFDDDVCSPRVILPISAAEKRKYNCTMYSRR